MSDLDALLKDFEQPKKSTIKESSLPAQKLPAASKPVSSKNDSFGSDRGSGSHANSNFPFATDQRRSSIVKAQTKPANNQPIDIDAILQGASTQTGSSSKASHPIAPVKSSGSSTGKDNLWDWSADDRLTTKSSNQSSNSFTHKVSTNAGSKPAIDVKADDLFFNTNHRDKGATNAPFSTNKPSATQYYLGSSRYKPGKLTSMPARRSRRCIYPLLGLNSKQTARRDSSQWLTDLTNNSNTTRMHHCQ